MQGHINENEMYAKKKEKIIPYFLKYYTNFNNTITLSYLLKTIQFDNAGLAYALIL